MIDSVRLHTEVKEENLIISKWNKGYYQKEECYFAFIGTLWMGYYPKTHSLIISGRLIGAVYYDRISNFDDIFESREEVISFFRIVNSKINSYFTGIELDILKLKVTKIDYCFNIISPYTNEYIEFFNRYYINNRETNFSKYKNYTVEADKDIESSFYIKTKSDYYNHLKRNFVINFYNKGNQLKNKKNKELEKRGFSNIKNYEITKGDSILRLEIQVGYNLLKKICKDNHISWSKRCLYDLFDINVATYVFYYQINRFFSSCDFYSYGKVKEILRDNGYKRGHKIYEYINGIAHHKKDVSSKIYEKKLKELNIFPYAFIPTKYKIDKLENPLKLIDKKIIEKGSYNLTLRRKEIIYVKRV